MPYLVKPDKEKVSKRTKISDTMNYVVIKSKGIVKKDFDKKIQMKKYKINGRNSSKLTVERLERKVNFDCIPTEEGIKKITNDHNNRYKDNFPDNYYEEFGKSLFYLVLNYSVPYNYNEVMRYFYALDYAKNLIDNEKNYLGGLGSPLFHIYENVVRKNDDTGLDKLKHFLFSAYYSFAYQPSIAKMLGDMKEFFKDEMWSWFDKSEIGWDNKDIEANKRGIEFGNKLAKQLGRR